MGAATWRSVQGNTVAPPGTQSARLWLFVAVDSAAPGEILIDNAFVYAGATCATTTQVLCLNDGRFRVYAQWALADGERGWGNVRAFTGDSGYSTFFDPANIELVVKVLDGCSYNGRFWVFAAGLTNVTVDLWVYDTEQDEYWTHHSPVDTAFQPVQDTTAFATCPH